VIFNNIKIGLNKSSAEGRGRVYYQVFAFLLGNLKFLLLIV